MILAAFCFMALAIMQVAWIVSAYNGEVALYTKAKKQLESELQSELSQSEDVKEGLSDLLDHHNREGALGAAQRDWFHARLVQAIDVSPKKSAFGLHVDGISIVKHDHKGAAEPGVITIVTNIDEQPDSTQIKEAGKLCIHCILGLKQELDNESDYQILFFYKQQWPAFYDKLGALILSSAILLILLYFLFREMIRRYEQEKKLSEAKNDFINNLTHELQTPVFAIQMANRLIKEKTIDPLAIAPLISIIEKETTLLKAHAGRILELASLEVGQVELSKDIIELNIFIKEKLPTIELMLRAGEGELEIKYHAEKLYSEADPVHFNNMLVSLVDNAIKYSEGPPRIIIETGTIDKMVFVRLTDSGIGIKPGYLADVTQKFFRVPHVKRNGIAGFGLGLSYVKHITDLHGGEFKIWSEEGKGTTVTILLPKAVQHA